MKHLPSVLLGGSLVLLVLGQSTCSVDVDGDGWTTDDGDCNDQNGDIYPGATELCEGLDGDCDELIDEGCGCIRAPLEITHAGLTGLDGFEVQLSLDASSLDWSLVTDTGADLAIYDENGQQLPHWLESWDTQAQEGRLWFQVPQLPAQGSSTVFLYYGDSSVVDSANPFDLFAFFDDFEDGSYSEWWHPSTSDVQLSESGGILGVWPSTSGDWGVAVANAELEPLSHGYAFVYQSRRVDTSCEGHGLYVFHEDSYNDPTSSHDGTGNDPQSGYRLLAGMTIDCSSLTGLLASESTGGSWTEMASLSLSDTGYTDDDWYRHELRYDVDAGSLEFGLDGVAEGLSFASDAWRGPLFSLATADDDAPAEFAYVFVRQYVSPEPTVTVGEAQNLCL